MSLEGVTLNFKALVTALEKRPEEVHSRMTLAIHEKGTDRKIARGQMTLVVVDDIAKTYRIGQYVTIEVKP